MQCEGPLVCLLSTCKKVLIHLLSFVNPCPPSPPYPPPLDRHHTLSALHTTYHRCARPALLWQAKCARLAGGATHHIRGHRAVLDDMRPTVCGSLHGNAAKLSMSDRHRHLASTAPPRPMDMSSAGVGWMLWDSVVLSSRCQDLSKEPSSSA